MTDYTTVQNLRDAIGSVVSGPVDDALLARLIAAVSGQIDRACNRPDGFLAAADASPREYPAFGGPSVGIDECVSVALVEARPSPAAEYAAWAETDWVAFSGGPGAPQFWRRPYTGLMIRPGGAFARFPDGQADGARPPMVRVTARWGFAETVPGAVEMACIIAAARLYQRGGAGFPDAARMAEALAFRTALDGEAFALLRAGRFVRPRA